MIAAPQDVTFRVEQVLRRHRAIDSTDATIVFLLLTLRDAPVAKQLFRMALSDPSHPQTPRHQHR